ncbi:unnamed protein product [Brugia timori]|uniref:Transposase n=1 Tax=Brugia timori TaxID=42155 RepID=A0A0R3QEX9_9BILA|nr:unnamed protein product [Brugia timori]
MIATFDVPSKQLNHRYLQYMISYVMHDPLIYPEKKQKVYFFNHQKLYKLKLFLNNQ